MWMLAKDNLTYPMWRKYSRSPFGVFGAILLRFSGLLLLGSLKSILDDYIIDRHNSESSKSLVSSGGKKSRIVAVPQYSELLF